MDSATTFPSTISAATDWLTAVLTGPLATALAVIAVAWLGLRLLGGELALRRGAIVVLGLFVVFSAPMIASALIAAAGPATGPASVVPATLEVPLPVLPSQAPAYDPYAGASVPH